MSSLVTDGMTLVANQSEFFDDFDKLDTTSRWTDVSGDPGSAPTLASDGDSAVVLTTGSADNAECYLVSGHSWSLQSGRQLIAEARVKALEANGDDLNFVFGLVSDAGANTLADDGSGPPADYSGAVIFKLDGETNWRGEVSAGAAQQTSEPSQFASSSPGWQILRIQLDVVRLTEVDVRYSIGDEGGSYFRQMQDASHLPVVHTIDGSGFGLVKLVIGAKAGGANSESPRVDYVRVMQSR